MRTLANVTLALGALVGLAGPLVLGGALGLEAVYEVNGDARYALGALLVALVPAVPVGLAVLVSLRMRGEEGASRAWLGAGLALFGLLLPIAGLLLFAGAAIVSVVGLWLSSLV